MSIEVLSASAAPRQVLLFSGHRVDAPDRAEARFPPGLVPRVAAAIGDALDALGAGPGDLAFAQAAAGGDLLFGAACLDRGVALQVWLPLAEPAFIAQSVLGSADEVDWLARYHALLARLDEPPRVMPAAGGDSFERGNTWLIAQARAAAGERARLRVICLWDGAPAEGPGGTAQVAEAFLRDTDRFTWIDTRRLLAAQRAGAP